jgi:hypothetical protein
MDEPTRIVVTLNEEEASTNPLIQGTPETPLVVTLSEPLIVRTDPTTESPALVVELPSQTQDRKWKWPRLAAAIVVIAMIIGGATGFLLTRPHSTSNPSTVSLPTHLQEMAATQRYLTGQGSVLVTMVGDAQLLERALTPASCHGVVIHTLDPLGSPAALLTTAEGVPNPDIQAALLNVLSALGAYIADCANTDLSSAVQSELNFSAVVAQRILSEVRLPHPKGIPV